jgi:non-canonical (house-cleaning) NTP pyrophosphatase
MYDNWFGLAVVCISDKNGRYGYGVTSSFQLPKIVVNEIKMRKNWRSYG